MNRFIVLHLLVLALLSESLAAAEIYKVINADGSVSYSDQPPVEGAAEEVVLPDLFVTPSVPVRPIASVTPTAAVTPKIVRIHSPLDEEIVRGSDNRLSVSVSVSPSIEDNEKLQLFQNGNAYGQPQSSGQWNLSRLNPGTHKISVQLLDANGQNRGQSTTVTVYVIL